ncbi:redoxin family protein [Pedobacter soli]|uniref:Thiol-disulfide isomerase or thioredoxin n=1 Tax=Pedobacter soli TaxID=390242 RepID=A0A1G6NDP8_9SPHI|nr:redoxin family protein [Pedobacter soli]SDC65999.1 Thiol-disulfide isomerase or thioredoxin [Pedobacter soli]
MKLKLCFLLLLCPFLWGYAQDNKISVTSTASGKVGIVIGQPVLEVVIQNVSGLDSAGRNFKPVLFSAFKGKLVILDFWASYCVPCITSFPKMKMLQEKYQNDLQVILVNNEPVGRAKVFLQKRRKEYGEAFISVFADTVLNKMFPHRTIPHYVWIGREGRVLAITGEEELEEEKLLQAMAGEGYRFVNKKNIDPALPLFSSADFPADSLVRYSLLTKGRVSGLASGTQFRKSKSSGVLVGRAFTNTDFFSLYGTVGRVLKRAEGQRFSDKQIRYLGADSLGFTGDNYNYEFVVPEWLSARLYPMMLDDLNTYSPYVGSFGAEVADCLVLERFDGPEVRLIRSVDEGVLGGPNYDSGNKNKLSLKNVSVEVLVDHLENFAWNRVPVINETGISDRIWIAIRETADLKQVNAGLRQYGLRLRPAKKKMEVMVIRDQIKQTKLMN